MITAKKLRAALNSPNGYAILEREDDKPKPRKSKRKKPTKRLLPPAPKKASPHVADKSVVWDDLQRELRKNSRHGFQRTVHEKITQPVSGQDMRNRITALGFTVTDFARRHGMSAPMFYEMAHFPSGMIKTVYIRIVEYEELLSLLVDIIEDKGLGPEDIRNRLEGAVDKAVANL